MKIVTHSGHFHADDVLAVATLLLKFPEAEVIRSREEKEIESADIVVDVGQVYDPRKLRFDHHQKAGAGDRANGIPYASFGLVWKYFGEELAGGVDEAKVVDDKLVSPVDAGDNGLSFSQSSIPGIRQYSLWDYFDSFSTGGEGMNDFDTGFFAALPQAKGLLEREIRSAKRAVENWKKVESIYDKSGDKKIIVLPQLLNWKRVLIPTEAVFVIWPKLDGWSVRGVPDAVHSFDVKKPFPTSWAGLEGETLAAVSGVKDAYFCHRNRWIAGVKSQEGAIELAKKALNA